MLVLHHKGWLDDHNRVPDSVEKRAVWPIGINSAPVLSLKPGWYPPGLLGGEREMAPTQLPSRRSDESYDRVRLASGKEQTNLGAVKPNPREIHNTQKTVNRTFSKGECVLKTLVDLVFGALEDI